MKIEVHAELNEYPTVINIASAVIDYFNNSTISLDGKEELEKLKEFNEYLSVYINHAESKMAWMPLPIRYEPQESEE